jgi:branched-subunit amino acid aminotransferase/4-amino-4-deoxychorismate lyase
MIGTTIIRNGQLEPVSAAMIAVDDPDAFHGYGCYEALRIRNGTLFFPEFHEERLLHSAAILGIQHAIQPGELVQALHRLASANGFGECNVKVVLFGREGRNADWFAFLLPPLYPPADSSTVGVTCTLFQGERPFPAAKSLGVLVSTLAFRQAKAKDCWDALLVNRHGEITEGTRTNLFYVEAPRRHETAPDSGQSSPDAFTVFTPPASDALEGITRRTLLGAMSAAGIPTAERSLTVQEALSGRFCLMLTSTSTGVVPVRMVIDEVWKHYELPIIPTFEAIQASYKQMLGRYAQGN